MHLFNHFLPAALLLLVASTASTQVSIPVLNDKWELDNNSTACLKANDELRVNVSDEIELECNLAGELPASMSIVFDSDEPECSNSQYPPGLIRSDNIYSNINDGVGFGQSTHTSALVNLQTNRFIVLSDFGTNNIDFRRRLVFTDAPTNYNLISQGFFSVSHCPGNFSESAVCNGVISNNTTLRFSTYPNDDPSFYCVLEPGESYYINFVLSPDPYNTIPSCRNSSHSECAIFYTESVL